MSKPFVHITLPESEKQKFAKWTNQVSQETKTQCKNIINTALYNIERKAKYDAPVDKGYLRGSYRVAVAPDGLGGEVYTGRKYAPYREWGTGKHVNVPTFVKTIFGVDSMEWKGAGIRKVNSKAKPHLFENAKEEHDIMIKKLNNLGFK